MPMLRNNNNINSYCPTTKTIELNTSKNPRVTKIGTDEKRMVGRGKDSRRQKSGVKDPGQWRNHLIPM